MSAMSTLKTMMRYQSRSSIKETFCKRFASTATHTNMNGANSSHKATYLQKHWLSDPSTYPLIIIMGSALTFMTGAGIHALRDYKDVKLSATKRNSPLQTWGYERVPSKVESFVSWNAHPPEGLGIDHEEWKKSKEQYKMMKIKESE